MSSAAVISFNLDEGKQYRLIERKSKVGDIVVDPYTRLETCLSEISKFLVILTLVS
jgi:hypothetical protein